MTNNTLPDLEIQEWLKLVAEKLKLSDDVVSYIDDVLNKCNNIWLPWNLDLKYTQVARDLNIREINTENFKKELINLLNLLITNPMINSREIMNITLALTDSVINEDKRLNNLKKDKQKKKKK